MQLPIGLPLALMQTRWKALIDPLLGNPVSGVSVLSNVQLNNGATVINHLLGRTMQGWFIIDIQGPLTQLPYRSAPFNSLTLTLTSNAVVTVSLGVF